MFLVQGLIKLLAVVGGFAVGALGVSLLLRFCGWWPGGKGSRLALAVRLLGSAVGGLLVWLLVTGPGGSLFGERGPGHGTGKEAASPAARPTNPNAARGTAPANGAHTLTVVMLGGRRVVGGKFYLLEGTAEPLTLDELKKAIRERRDRDPALKAVEIKIYQDSVASIHPAVTDLKRWAQGQGLTVNQPPPENGNLP